MQYTLRNVPKNVDRALRERARREGRSLNEIALAALEQALGLGPDVAPRRSLADVVGTWVADADVERALDEQRAVDPEEWR